MAPFRTRDKDVVCANGGCGGGGLRPPPTPALVFLHRAGFLSRTLHHQQDLLRAHNCYRPVLIPSCRQSICKRGCCLPPNPGASHMDLVHPACRHYSQMGGCHCVSPPPPPRFFKLCKKTSSIILPAKTEPIWTGSEPAIKALCLQMGGGGAAPLQPPAFFLRRAGLLSRASYHEQELVQAHRGYRPFQIPPCMQSICKWWGYVSRSHMGPFRTRDLCLQMGGGAAPPQSPQLSFYAAQACFQKHRTINTACFTSITVLELFKPIMLAVHLQTGGLRPPQPRTSLSCTRPLQVSFCQQKQNPYGPFQNP